MLAPIEPHRLLPQTTSFATSAGVAEELDRFADTEGAELVAGHGWLKVARTCPPLARILVSIAQSSCSPSTKPMDRLRHFCRRPDWVSFADKLSEVQDDFPPLTDVAAIAHLARVVAHETGWSTAEHAFWHSLTETARIPQCRHTVELAWLEGYEKCRVVARWALDAIATDGPRPETGGILSPREAVRAIDSMSDEMDPDLLFAEVHVAREFIPQGLDVATTRRLAALARLAGYRQESRWHDQLFNVISARDSERALNASRPLLDAWLGDCWGIWIEAPARGGLARWIVPNELNVETGFVGSRERLEANALPSCYRSSRDLVTSEQKVVGRLYAERPIEGTLYERWIGRFAAAIGTFQERQLAKQAEEVQAAAQEMVKKAREADTVKFRREVGEFSAGAGHEINNPLGAISGHATRLLRGEADPDRRHALVQINNQVDRIRRMIKDLQLIGGNIPVNRSKIPVSSILDAAAQQAEKRLSKGRRIFQSCDPHWQIEGDLNLLARMVAEIVVNGAEAAGPSGQVRVWAEPAHDQDSAIDIVVADSGPGISTHARERAFIPFFSGREAGRGLGMGLPVADRIAFEHGGEIIIGYGKPTTIRVHLPSELRKAC